jgi:hypothetical protein
MTVGSIVRGFERIKEIISNVFPRPISSANTDPK